MINVYIVEILGISELRIGNPNSKKHRIANPMQRKYGLKDEICEKGYRGKPLTDEQKQNNRIKSKDRCRIEHIFGFIEGAMNGSLVRSIGMVRAKAANALTNLVYNISRYVQINIYQPQLITCEG